ncbi:hypothetical protein, partial [Frankia sp. CiP3]|uniref:hypothetical protein n=1 Tax=Frankia sp. CiP3 TaxID=2880971 RepID=UPI001EF6E3CF
AALLAAGDQFAAAVSATGDAALAAAGPAAAGGHPAVTHHLLGQLTALLPDVAADLQPARAWEVR